MIKQNQFAAFSQKRGKSMNKEDVNILIRGTDLVKAPGLIGCTLYSRGATGKIWEGGAGISIIGKDEIIH